MAEQQASVSPVVENATTTSADALDLNPTAFVDDLHNAVELHCATAFDELDIALRTALDDRLSPEQAMALLRGTAGLYQSLRMELRNRMQTFEQYALAEILKVPPGLLPTEAPTSSSGCEEALTEEELSQRETETEAKLKSLRQDIAAAKRRTRDMNAAVAELDSLISSTQSQLADLQAVPTALAGQDGLEDEIQAIANKGVAVEAACMKLDALQGTEHAGDGHAIVGGVITTGVDEGMPDAAVEREILRQQAAAKAAPTEELRKVREGLGI